MSDTNESTRKNSEMENLSLRPNRFATDLLQRFMGSSQNEFLVVKEEDSEEIELNLGLSLGGRFGVDKSTNVLKRSSSIAGFMPHEVVEPEAVAGLVRTSSLPVETEEEWRKRKEMKEMQTLRRMEAMRRRSEKQRNLKGERDGGGGGCLGEIEGNLRGRIEREQYIAAMNRVGSSVGPPFGLPAWAAAARQDIVGGAVGGGGGGVQGFVQPSAQGSIESQGGSSSSLTELESRPLQGSSSCGEVSPGSIQSLKERSNQDAVGSSGTKTRENASRPPGGEMESPSKRTDVAGSSGKETRMSSLEDMPCVFTKGEGPNGRRIEGILYKYGKGEEVKIMCVCHGTFHSPAGFVRHSGGGDVDHPLKHIVIKPNSSSFL